MLYQSFEKLDQNLDCLVVGIHDNNILKNQVLSEDLIQELQSFLDCEKMPDKKGAYLLLHNLQNSEIKKVLFLKTEADNFIGLGKTLLDVLKNTTIQSIGVAVGIDENCTKTMIKEMEYLSYKYDTTLSKKSIKPSLETVVFYGDEKITKLIIEKSVATAIGVNFARQLANLPANYCTPSDIAEQSMSLASDKIEVSVMGESEMESLGMGSLLSVSQGSAQEAKLITLQHNGNQSDRPFVLVGKGVTFDTGGISLKPGSAMDEMKFDMCGAASVLGVFKALSILDLPINVVGIIPSVENMPSGKATKPGDVVTSMSGQTIEILNTDAEGRLILCDALTYAKKFNPKQVIDIATLTGAVIVALGRNISGLMSNDEKLADELLTAGIESDDKLWRLPLADYDESYDELLDSNFADIANIGGRGAGTVTAGCFLAKFTKNYQWAHLDIAGTAWKDGKEKGATGRPVNLLMQYLLDKTTS